MTDFNDFLFAFLESVHGFPVPRKPMHTADWETLSGEALEARASHYYLQHLPDMLAWETEAARRATEDKTRTRRALGIQLAKETETLQPADIAPRYSVEDKLYQKADFASDIIQIKINHGFWEQYFVITADGYQPQNMRPMIKKPYMDQYLHSRFADALQVAIDKQAEIRDGVMQFGPVDFGFSFNAGGMRHQRVMELLGDAPVTDLIMRGVFAGSQSWFRQWDGVETIKFTDGTFAKMRLLDGELTRILSTAAKASDHVMFCVPPHLKSVLLRGIKPARQSRLLISGTLVHNAWPLMLNAAAKPIIERLARGETVTVLVQACVFSALLGLFLSLAKTGLNLPGRLYFFDLGQALDVAGPETAGQWVRNVTKRGNLRIDNNPFSIEP